MSTSWNQGGRVDHDHRYAAGAEVDRDESDLGAQTRRGGFTEVLFRQTGWPANLDQGDWHTSLAGLTFAWAGVLRALKGYAETGSAQLHFTTVPR